MTTDEALRMIDVDRHEINQAELEAQGFKVVKIYGKKVNNVKKTENGNK